MKKLFPLLILLFALSAKGQTVPPAEPALPGKAKTNLETFQEKYGSVIVQGYTPVGEVVSGGRTVKVQAKEFKSASSTAKVKGLLIEVETGERYASSGRAFVEYDEIESLVKGIVFISKIDKSVTALNSFEATYKTKGDFSVTVFNDTSGTIKAAVSVGSVSQKTMFTPLVELTTLVLLLQKAKSVLDELK
jgi:hypothetical protein